MRGFRVCTVATLAIFAASWAAPSQAIVSGVASITVTSAIPNYLQISELIATQAVTGTDVALASLGATTSVSSNYGSGDNPSYAIDGIVSTIYPTMFHSNGFGSGEFFTVSFAAPADLSGVTIYGRSDCCTFRDVYNVTLADVTGVTLFTGQIDASADGTQGGSLVFDAPVTDVPEPASMMLLGAGLIGAGLVRRRINAA